jgi:hypothetical protein
MMSNVKRDLRSSKVLRSPPNSHLNITTAADDAQNDGPPPPLSPSTAEQPLIVTLAQNTVRSQGVGMLQFGGPGVSGGDLLMQMQRMFQEMDAKFSAKIDDLSKSIETIKEDIKDEFVSRIANNEGNIAAHEVRLTDVEEAVRSLKNEVEAASKTNDLIIRGVPMAPSEDVVDVYCKIATAIGFAPDTIPRVQIFRMGKKTNANFDPPLLVKFADVIDRKTFYTNYFRCKTLNLSQIGFNSTQRIYITENLTKRNQEIYAAAMKLRYEKKIWSVSTSNGVVMVRRREADRPAPVLSLAELST